MGRFLFLISFLSFFSSSGQNFPVPAGRVKGTYDGTLDEFLQDVAKTNDIKIRYHPEDVEGMTMRQMFLNQELSSVLEMIKKEYKLKYVVEEDGTIVFSSRKKEYKKIEQDPLPSPISSPPSLPTSPTSLPSLPSSSSPTYSSPAPSPIYAVPQKRYKGAPSRNDFTISGIIKDSETGEGLPYALIKIKGTNIGVLTNSDGLFTLTKVPTDTNTLFVTYMGFQQGTVFLSPETPSSDIAIELKPITNSQDEIVVQGERESLLKVPQEEISVVKMNPKAVASLPNVGEKDIMRALQLLPGVSASYETASGLYVRGGTPDQNLVQYDGFTVYQVDHLYGFFSAFNYNALKDVQLYKGGYGSKFGGRLSSVTEVTGKEGNNKKFNAGGDISLLSGNLFAEGPLGKKFTFLLAARKSYKGPLYNKIFKEFNTGSSSSQSTPNGGGFGGGGRRGGASAAATVASYFYDLNSKLSFKPNTKDIFTLSIYNGTDKLDNSTSFGGSRRAGGGNANFSASTSDLTKYGNVGTSIKWARKWNDIFYNNTLLSYSDFYSTRNRSTQVSITNSTGQSSSFSSGIFEHNNLQDFSLKSDFVWDPHKNHQISFGVNASYYDIAYNYSQNDTSVILDNHNFGKLYTVYAQDKIRLFNNRVSLIPGIRSSYFGVTGQVYNEPRLSMTYRLSDQLILKGATGRYYQFVNQITREDILNGNKTFWVLSDGKNIPVSSSTHYIAGLSYETSNYVFSMEGYYKALSDISQYTLRFNNTRGGDGVTKYNENYYVGSGIARGIEWMVQRKTGKLTGWVCYTLGQVQNSFSVYSASAYPAAQDVRNEFKVVGVYKLKKWSFSATWIYATGKPYTAPQGGYELTLLNGSTRDFVTVSTVNSNRFPSYHRMDVAVNYLLFSGGEGEEKHEIGYLGFSVFNAYNHTNVWYYNYTVVEDQVVSNAYNYLGITPNITLSLRLR